MPLTPLALNDGASHTITSAYGTITVTNGSTLNLNSGGSGTGPDFDASALLGIWVGLESGPGITNDSSTLNLSAGSAAGGSSTVDGGGSMGLVSLGGSVLITGGSFVGGVDSLVSPPAAMISSPGACDISGGTFTGGSSGGVSGGTGLILYLTGSTNATISGGTFTGGSPGGFSLGLSLDDTATLTISGGVYSGTIKMRFASSSPYVLFTGSSLVYSGGVLTGTLSDGHAISVAIEEADGGTLSVGGTTGMLAFHQ